MIEQLRNLILSENMRVGDKLPNERALAERLGVSRIIVREAISYLKACGIVESRHGSGNYIVKVPSGFLDPNNGSLEYDVDELIDSREMLEIAIAQRYLRNFSTDIVHDMIAAIQSMEANFKKGDLFQVIEHDVRFHRIYSQACSNLIISSFLYQLANYMKTKVWFHLKRDYLWDKAYQERSINTHKKIVEAISQQDLDLVIKAIIEHYKNIREHLEL